MNKQEFFEKIQNLNFKNFSNGMKKYMTNVKENNYMHVYRSMHPNVQMGNINTNERHKYTNMTSPISLKTVKVPYVIVGSPTKVVYTRKELERIYKNTGKDPLTRNYFTHIAKLKK